MGVGVNLPQIGKGFIMTVMIGRCQVSSNLEKNKHCNLSESISNIEPRGLVTSLMLLKKQVEGCTIRTSNLKTVELLSTYACCWGSRCGRWLLMRSVVMNVSVRLEVVYSAEDIRGFEERRVDESTTRWSSSWRIANLP